MRRLTLNLQGRDGQFPYTPAVYFSSPETAQNYGFRIGELRSGLWMLFVRVEFFDERHAVDFVQGRNPAKNLLQGRFSQAS